jgi:hypothetical protein
MAGTQEAVDHAKAENIRKTINIAGRDEQQYLLLSSTYPLNSSQTKKIHVGLQSSEENGFVPIVKLSGNSAEGINFDHDTWQRFKGHMKLMSGYLNDSNKTKINPVSFANIFVSFTTSYGAKAILISYKENEEPTPTTEEAQPPMKKRKPYAVAVAMQSTTFQGLLSVVDCVDARISQLASIADNVAECAEYLLKEIELHLPKNYIDTDIIRLTFRGNREDIERAVRTQINNLNFLDTYFSIVVLEIATFKFKDIVNVILRNRGL